MGFVKLGGGTLIFGSLSQVFSGPVCVYEGMLNAAEGFALACWEMVGFPEGGRPGRIWEILVCGRSSGSDVAPAGALLVVEAVFQGLTPPGYMLSFLRD